MRRYKICRQLGRKIAIVRKRQKISQEELASKAGLYLTTVGKIERGESNPTAYTYLIDKRDLANQIIAQMKRI